jgi:WhiB family redox-sensing transcriptional regulator
VVNPDHTPDYEAMAAGLDRWRLVPTDVLTTVVVRGGVCFWRLWPSEEPDWDNYAHSDQDLATRLCTGCPVIDQCRELDLRTAGADTTGVWGAMPEDNRRALHPIWQRRRQHQDTTDRKGEPTS